MSVRGLFVSGDGRARAGWRILTFLALFFAITVAAGVALKLPLSVVEAWTGIKDSADEVALMLGAIGAHIVMIRWVDRRAWSYVWLDRGAASGRTLGFGFLLGGAPIAATSLALLAVGWLAITSSPPGSWTLASLHVSAVLLPAALFEELVSRGYVLAALKDGLGAPTAVMISSAAFGLLHYGNPGATVQPIILVTLAGIFLAVVLLATRSLYAAWAAHFAWNWVMAVPLHIAVSGEQVPTPGYEMVSSGPAWATGGAWGPEGGAAAGLAMVAVMAWLYRRNKNAQRTTQNA